MPQWSRIGLLYRASYRLLHIRRRRHPGWDLFPWSLARWQGRTSEEDVAGAVLVVDGAGTVSVITAVKLAILSGIARIVHGHRELTGVQKTRRRGNNEPRTTGITWSSDYYTWHDQERGWNPTGFTGSVGWIACFRFVRFGCYTQFCF